MANKKEILFYLVIAGAIVMLCHRIITSPLKTEELTQLQADICQDMQGIRLRICINQITQWESNR
jgi:hypothetical protein